MLTLPGNLWRDKYQATVDGILIPHGLERKVVSAGDRFFNQDRWTAKAAYNALLKHADLSPQALRAAAAAAQAVKAVDPLITIARAPDKLSWEMALALNGGAAHEAWHTVFSMRNPITHGDLQLTLQPYQGLKLAAFQGILGDGLDNYLEDVRIERLGLAMSPPFRQSMHQLQDFILHQEGRIQDSPRAVFLATLRDFGFGYKTEKLKEAMTTREADQPKVMQLFTKAWLQGFLQGLKEKDSPLAFLGQSFELCSLLEKHRCPTVDAILGDPSAPQALDHGKAFQLAIPKLTPKQVSGAFWNPQSTARDHIWVPGAGGPSDEDTPLPSCELDGVQQELNYLRSRLRTILRSSTMTRTCHGARRGTRLSGRNLARTAMEAQSGEEPSQPFTRKTKRVELSVAAAVSLDLSGSTGKIREPLARTAMLITEAIEGVQGQVLSFGWSDFGYGPASPSFHRTSAVCYTVFKDFRERTSATRGRYSRAKVQGTTPMADGIQFGLHALQHRKETLKLMFVITDGNPNPGTTPVVKAVLREAWRQQIAVIGIGIGQGCSAVKALFPQSLVRSCVSEIPEPLTQLLTQVLK